MNKRLIKEYIKLLSEEEHGSGYDFSGMGDSPYGYCALGGKSFFKIFVEPFADVFKTAKAELSKVSTKTRSFMKVLFGSLMSLIIPGLEVDYKKIYDKEKEEINKIQEKYADVYARTDKALEDSGLMRLALFVDPVSTITTTGVLKAVKAPKSAIDAIFGPGSYKNISDYIKQKFSKNRNKNENLQNKIYEFNGKISIKLLKEHLQESHSANKLSPRATEAQETAKKVAKEKLNAIYKNYLDIHNATSINDISKFINSSEGKKKIQEFNKLPANEKKSAEDLFLNQIRESSKKFYLLKLKSEVDHLKSKKISDEHLLVRYYNMTIEKIQQL